MDQIVQFKKIGEKKKKKIGEKKKTPVTKLNSKNSQYNRNKSQNLVPLKC